MDGKNSVDSVGWNHTPTHKKKKKKKKKDPGKFSAGKVCSSILIWQTQILTIYNEET